MSNHQVSDEVRHRNRVASLGHPWQCQWPDVSILQRMDGGQACVGGEPHRLGEQQDRPHHWTVDESLPELHQFVPRGGRFIGHHWIQSECAQQTRGRGGSSHKGDLSERNRK